MSDRFPSTSTLIRPFNATFREVTLCREHHWCPLGYMRWSKRSLEKCVLCGKTREVAGNSFNTYGGAA